MPIRFSSIPTHIQLQIIGKLDIKDFVYFIMSSKDALDLSTHLKTLITVPRSTVKRAYFDYSHEVAYLHYGRHFLNLSQLSGIRFDFKQVTINMLKDDFCLEIIKFFKYSGSTVRNRFVFFPTDVDLCSPALFYEMLMVLNVKKFVMDDGPTIFMTNFPKNINSVQIYATLLTDEDFVKINVNKIRLYCSPNITSLGLKTVLQEWAASKRKISWLSINTEMTPGPFHKETILSGLEYSKTSEPDIFTIDNGSEMLHIDLRRKDAIAVTVNLSRLLAPEYDSDSDASDDDEDEDMDEDDVIVIDDDDDDDADDDADDHHDDVIIIQNEERDSDDDEDSNADTDDEDEDENMDEDDDDEDVIVIEDDDE